MQYPRYHDSVISLPIPLILSAISFLLVAMFLLKLLAGGVYATALYLHLVQMRRLLLSQVQCLQESHAVALAQLEDSIVNSRCVILTAIQLPLHNSCDYFKPVQSDRSQIPTAPVRISDFIL
jgi:hypothetical protein